ncbi:MAG: chromate transporter [Candidatus Solibacter sp.]|nr:chromate transporter [Candidatus Solibacter sp.]
MAPSNSQEPCSVAQLLKYFLRLGTVGFGGPIALAGRMDRDLVEKRGWLSKQDYIEGLAFSQLSPGPLAAQLAMYIGWVRAGRIGAALVAVAFIAPSFLMAVVVAAAYLRFERMPWIQDIFYGVGAAVIAIIAQSAYRLSRKTIGKDLFLWLLFAGVAITTVWTGSEIVWLFILCGVLSVIVKKPPAFVTRPSSRALLIGFGSLSTGLQGAASGGLIWTLTLFFLKAGAFVFGSGLAIVPFLYGGVVSQYHWLTERQFVDAIAVAMITPGPVVITAAFIGYLVAGLVGGAAAAAAVFAPPFLIVIVAAPYYRRFAGNPQVRAFVQGVTAAAVGAIAGAVVILAKRSLVDWVTVLIALLALVALLKLKKIPEPVLILAAGIVGLLVHRSVS